MWVEEFRSVRQEFIAKILNNDSSKKFLSEGNFLVKIEISRPFIFGDHIFRCLKSGFRLFNLINLPFFGGQLIGKKIFSK